MVVHFSRRSVLNEIIFSLVVIRRREEYSGKGNDVVGLVLMRLESLQHFHWLVIGFLLFMSYLIYNKYS